MTLAAYPITTSQAWAVVKLVYTSNRYTDNQQDDIYNDQKTKAPLAA